MNPVTILIIGAGSRGGAYSSFAEKFPDEAKVVGVAEPRDWYREDLAKRHGIPTENSFTDWKEAAQRERFADAVVVATQDAMHVAPAVAFAQKGYHMLLRDLQAETVWRDIAAWIADASAPLPSAADKWAEAERARK